MPLVAFSINCDSPDATSGMASSQFLPQVVVALQISDTKTQAAFASILPKVEFGSSTQLWYATFMDDSVELQGEPYIPPVQPTS